MKAHAASELSAAPEATLRARSRQRVTTVAALAALACTGATSCTRTQVALSATAVAAVIVGTTVSVTYAVQHHHHTLEGCVFTAGNELKLRTGDAIVYRLKGDAVSMKAGDRVRLHGSKLKRAHGDSTGEQVFVVDKLNMDYGPCRVGTVPGATP